MNIFQMMLLTFIPNENLHKNKTKRYSQHETKVKIIWKNLILLSSREMKSFFPMRRLFFDLSYLTDKYNVEFVLPT